MNRNSLDWLIFPKYTHSHRRHIFSSNHPVQAKPTSSLWSSLNMLKCPRYLIYFRIENATHSNNKYILCVLCTHGTRRRWNYSNSSTYSVACWKGPLVYCLSIHSCFLHLWKVAWENERGNLCWHLNSMRRCIFVNTSCQDTWCETESLSLLLKLKRAHGLNDECMRLWVISHKLWLATKIRCQYSSKGFCSVFIRFPYNIRFDSTIKYWWLTLPRQINI